MTYQKKIIACVLSTFLLLIVSFVFTNTQKLYAWTAESFAAAAKAEGRSVEITDMGNGVVIVACGNGGMVTCTDGVCIHGVNPAGAEYVENRGGGGGGEEQVCSPAAGSACKSGSNECGQTNSGSIDCSGSCNAQDPSNSTCPPPTVSCTGTSTTPTSPINYFAKKDDIVKIDCTATPATTCEVTSSDGLYERVSSTVSYTTPPVKNTTDYALTCWTEGKHGMGPKTAQKVRVNLNPGFHEI